MKGFLAKLFAVGLVCQFSALIGAPLGYFVYNYTIVEIMRFYVPFLMFATIITIPHMVYNKPR